MQLRMANRFLGKSEDEWLTKLQAYVVKYDSLSLNKTENDHGICRCGYPLCMIFDASGGNDVIVCIHLPKGSLRIHSVRIQAYHNNK